jgi:membrane protein DedA with SNARE-associated domain
MTQEAILTWFSQYAYHPLWVYSGMTGMMFVSAFGFPLPEEVPLIGSGLVAYMGRHPEVYPAPAGASSGRVHVLTLAIVAFAAVVMSDYLVFYLGRYSVRHIEARGWFQRMVKPEMMTKLRRWMSQYGIWACGVFRFAPGLRFPGFMACGALGIRRRHFLFIDGLAALLSVPTQVVLVGVYGATILKHFKEIKLVLAAVVVTLLVAYLIRKWWRPSRRAQPI